MGSQIDKLGSVKLTCVAVHDMGRSLHGLGQGAPNLVNRPVRPFKESFTVFPAVIGEDECCSFLMD